MVHTQSADQAVAQCALALESGAAGVFVIDHGRLGLRGLLDAFAAVRTAHPTGFVGINLLNGGPQRAFAALALALRTGVLPAGPDAVWVDDLRGDGSLTPPGQLWPAELAPRPWLYGGVSFKYTPTYTDDPATAAAELDAVRTFCDIPTTSGAGTGSAPPPAKLAAMHERVGNQPLAVASGISAANLAEYAGSVDHVLAATSIETAPYSGVFDPAALRDLVAAVASAGPTGNIP